MANLKNAKYAKKRFLTLSSQGPQPSSLEDGWVHNTQKTWEFYFGPFQSFHLVTHWEKAIKIG